jgi:hypothetical protein
MKPPEFERGYPQVRVASAEARHDRLEHNHAFEAFLRQEGVDGI